MTEIIEDDVMGVAVEAVDLQEDTNARLREIEKKLEAQYRSGKWWSEFRKFLMNTTGLYGMFLRREALSIQAHVSTSSQLSRFFSQARSRPSPSDQQSASA